MYNEDKLEGQIFLPLRGKTDHKVGWGQKKSQHVISVLQPAQHIKHRDMW